MSPTFLFLLYNCIGLIGLLYSSSYSTTVQISLDCCIPLPTLQLYRSHWTAVFLFLLYNCIGLIGLLYSSSYSTIVQVSLDCCIPLPTLQLYRSHWIAVFLFLFYNCTHSKAKTKGNNKCFIVLKCTYNRKRSNLSPRRSDTLKLNRS